MKKNYLFVLIIVALNLWGCKQDNDGELLDEQLASVLDEAAPGSGKAAFLLPKSNDLGSIPQDPRNPLTPEKIALGKLLYHETATGVAPKRMEGLGTFSCASCHFAEAGFQAGRVQGIGEGGTGFGIHGETRQRNTSYTVDLIDVQPIRTPTVLNTAFQELMLWNGQFGATGDNVGTEAKWVEGTPIFTNFLGYEGLETQAIAGQTVHRLDATQELVTALGYKSMFDAAFHDWPEGQRYTKETAGLAIAAYERTVLANQAPFQRWLQGNTGAMSDAAKRGAIVFFGKADCVSCHSGPALSSMSFHALGMNDLDQCPEEIFQTPANAPAHLGRGGFTGRNEDNYKFKTPGLYNLLDSPFYGHGSSFRSIEEVVVYKNKGLPQNNRVPTSQISTYFRPLQLSQQEISDLVVFLRDGLYDPDLLRYVPERLLSGQCFPNNDPQSREDRGCN